VSTGTVALALGCSSLSDDDHNSKDGMLTRFRVLEPGALEFPLPATDEEDVWAARLTEVVTARDGPCGGVLVVVSSNGKAVVYSWEIVFPSG
jgi:hypothetical protein